MSVPRIFIDEDPLPEVFTPAEAVRHYLLRVRRLADGGLVSVFNRRGSQAEYQCRTEGDGLRLERTGEIGTDGDGRGGEIVLLQPILTRRKLELIVQKTTELGIDRLVLYHAGRSVARWRDPDDRLERLRRISLEACRQCGRTRQPEIGWTADPLADLPQGRRLVFSTLPGGAALGALSLLEERSKDRTIILAAGPEGGFTEDELSARLEAGFEPVWLGRQILRTETASILSVGLAALSLGRLGE